jgi:hypothetical protein
VDDVGRARARVHGRALIKALLDRSDAFSKFPTRAVPIFSNVRDAHMKERARARSTSILFAKNPFRNELFPTSKIVANERLLA